MNVVATEPVTVTWMDGTEETYGGECRLSEGVLHVYTAEQSVHIPLASVRYWIKP